MTRTKKTAAPQPVFTAAGIKGFDANLQCRGFQFALGEVYTHVGPVNACASGFHCVTGHPLAVFTYYAPAGSRFCRVDISGELDSDDNEKTAGEILKIGAEIGISDLVADAVAWVSSRTTLEGERATGTQGASSATGTQGASSATGTQGASSATGDQGASSATGYQGASSATGYQGASSATGDQGASSATGTRGASSATGYQGAAMAIGFEGRVMGATGNALFSVERSSEGDILSVACGIVGRDGLQPDIWYRALAGRLVEV
jgi:hypothetical protein